MGETRAEKASSDMFKFFEALASHDKAIDAGRALTCWRKFKDPSLQTKSTKNERPPENSV